VAFLAMHEKVAHLDDLVLRRSNLAMYGELTLPLLEELADVLGNSLGWQEAQKKAEVERALDLLKDKHGVSL
jgi:glycerol-3-phosphate dehydrogenase